MNISFFGLNAKSSENLGGLCLPKRVVSVLLSFTLLNSSLLAGAEAPATIFEGEQFFDALSVVQPFADQAHAGSSTAPTQVVKTISQIEKGASQGYAEGEALASFLKVPSRGKALFSNPGAVLGSLLAVAICTSELSKRFGKLEILDKNVRIAFSWGYSFFWSIKNRFGYYQTPRFLKRVLPQSSKHPDGALPYEKLVYDPSDPSSIKIRSSVEAALAGEPLKNAIYYGDAGTGKSASVQSFAHMPNFEVYSVSGDNLWLWSFMELTEWVKNVSSANRRILIDISEGDKLLERISSDSYFRNHFKRNFDREQAHHAVVISCNFNTRVSSAIKIISRDQDLARRFEDRVRFSSPGPKTRLALLKKSVFATIDRKFPEDNDVEEFFRETFFGDDTLLNEKVIAYTSDLSHSRVENLGEKIVFLYALARTDLANGVHSSLMEFDFIDDQPSVYLPPLERILTFMSDRNSENEWLEHNEKLLLEQQYKERLEKMKYAKIEAEYNGLIDKAKKREKTEKSQNKKGGSVETEPEVESNKASPEISRSRIKFDDDLVPAYW